ncbi:MAG: hypothetical protein AB3A66_25425 [Nodularia sp. CChRGM 3473]
MKREVITKRDVQNIQKNVEPYAGAIDNPSIPERDDYQSKLLKYIPTEVVALYFTLDNILKSSVADQQSIQTLLWIIFILLIISTPIYLWRVTKVRKKIQLMISTLAFIVWVFALGGIFENLDWYRHYYGALLLPSFTFIVPIIEG